MAEEAAMTDLHPPAKQQSPEDTALREVAVKKLQARRGLQAHALAYVLVTGSWSWCGGP